MVAEAAEASFNCVYRDGANTNKSLYAATARVQRCVLFDEGDASLAHAVAVAASENCFVTGKTQNSSKARRESAKAVRARWCFANFFNADFAPIR